VNKVLLTGRLTRDPELRSLASGSSVAQFVVATNEFRGNGKERAEYHNVVVWDRLAEICGQFLGKGQQVLVEGRLQTRQWDDDRGSRHCQVSPRWIACLVGWALTYCHIGEHVTGRSPTKLAGTPAGIVGDMNPRV
jgi:hypothetical protein